MATKNFSALLKENAAAMAYVVVSDQEGDQKIGSAFHVGDGVFVTARHVIENNKILELKLNCNLGNEAFEIAKGPFYHKDSKLDVAAFQLNNIDPKVSVVTLGGHLDDWINDEEWLLSEVLVLGYPPIPYSSAIISFSAFVSGFYRKLQG